MLARLAAFALVLSTGACHHEAAHATATWEQDVAPLVAAHCARCHGGFGHDALVSPPLGTYETAARNAGVMSFMVQRREMPPWGADDTGLCGRFADSRWLPPAAISTIADWATHGAPRGTPAHSPTAIAPDPLPALAGGARVRVTTEAYTPSLGRGATRCFLVEPHLPEGALVRGIAGDAATLRQLALYAPSDEELARARAMSAKDGAPGWPCYDEPATETLVASWSWNLPSQPLPDGTGVRVPPGRPLVLLVRYNLVAAGLAPVRAAVDIDAGPARAAELRVVAPRELDLPPGHLQTTVTAELTVDAPLWLLGVVPRLHTLGRTFRLEKHHGQGADAVEECLAWLGHWSVYDEQLFRYRAPIALAPGDRIRLECSYATTGREEAVREGSSSDEETCRGYLYVTPR